MFDKAAIAVKIYISSCGTVHFRTMPFAESSSRLSKFMPSNQPGHIDFFKFRDRQLCQASELGYKIDEIFTAVLYITKSCKRLPDIFISEILCLPLSYHPS